MPTVLRAAIFNHETILVDDDDLISETCIVLRELKREGISIIVFSTHHLSIEEEFAARGYPPCDMFVTEADMNGKRKGSQDWIYYVGSQMGLAPHEFVYVGDDKEDWFT